MATIDFHDIAELLNRSRTTRLETVPTKSREGRWALYPGTHLVHTSSYPFQVLYFNAAATLEDMRFATRDLADQQSVHIVYPPSLQRLITKNLDMPALRVRPNSLWNTKEYIISFIKDELEVYLSRLKELKPAVYTQPHIRTPSGFSRKVPNPVRSFLVDPPTDDSVGKLGILLAEPGQGKTHMSNYLVSQLAKGEFGVVPLMVDSSQWQSLSVNDQRSLPKTIAHSFRHFGATIGWLDGNEDLFLIETLKADIFRIIFDGFDEYILHNRGTVQPLDVLEALAELASKTGTRIVITSRTSFWHTNLPSEEIDKFVEEKGAFIFSILPFDREHAKNYFEQRLQNEASREKALQTYDILRAGSTDLIGRGFVLNLIADLADRGGTSPLPGHDTSRPMLWLVEKLCQREIIRQELPFTAQEQLDILRQFAVESAEGEKPNTDLLSLVLTYIKPTLDFHSTTGTIEKFISHPLLAKDAQEDRWSFRQEQIRIMLLADYIVRASDKQAREFGNKAQLTPGARQDLGEMVVELLQMQSPQGDPLGRLSVLVKAMSAPHEGQSELGTQSTEGPRIAATISLAAVEKKMPAGNSRADRANFLRNMSGESKIRGLTFSGAIASFDFSDMEFQECKFERVTWANCRFNAKSRFENCEFVGGVPPVKCTGLGSVNLEDCRLDPEAEALFNLLRIREGNRRYSTEDLRGDIESVIDKFVIKGGIGLKSVENRNLIKGTIAYSRHRQEVIEVITSLMLEQHHISGTGKGYNIKPEAVESVKFYATNNVFTGHLGEVFEVLKRRLQVITE